MLLTRTRALASATFVGALLIAPMAAESDSGTRGVLSLGSSTEPAPTAAQVSLGGAPAVSSGTEAVLRSYYPDLQTGGPETGSVDAAVVGTSQPSPPMASPVNPFVVSPAGVQAQPVAAPAPNPFALPVAPQAEPGVVGGRPNAPAFSIDGATAPGAKSGEGNAIDESALRYYADQRNLERVGAEIRRLKALYPTWNPPADLFAPKSSVNEQPLWDLLAAGRVQEARNRIADYQAKDPKYRPSADLTGKLDDADIRTRIRASSDAGNWKSTLAAAQERPSLLVCTEVDVLWRVGEALARTDDLARAFDLYSYILTTCGNPAERLATMQKAALLLPQNGVDALATYGQTLPNGSREFDGMRYQKTRAEIGEEIAKGTKRSRIEPNELKAFETHAKTTQSADDASLLGWFHYNALRFEDAKDWFSLASEIDDNPKHLEGYILSLRNLDDLEAAEELAYREWDSSPEMAKIYVELVAERLNEAEELGAAELGRYTEVVEDSRSALGAQTLGWHLLAAEKTEEAGEWFEKSVEWETTEEGVVGMAVVASRTKDAKGLKAIKAEYGDTFASLAEIEEYVPPARVVSQRPAQPQAPAARGTRRAAAPARSGGGGGGDRLMRQANQQFDAGDYNGAIATLNQREARNGKSYGAEILKGWANIKLKRWNEAERIFRTQDQRQSTRDTRFGIGAVANSKYNMWPDTRNDCTVRWKC